MKHITSLKTFPSMTAAYNACTALYLGFKQAHKRAEKVALTVCAQGDPKGPQTYEVRCHWERDHEADKAWFAAEIQSL